MLTSLELGSRFLDMAGFLFQAAAGFRMGFHRHLLHQSPMLFHQVGDFLTSQDEADSPKKLPKVGYLRTGP